MNTYRKPACECVHISSVCPLNKPIIISVYSPSIVYPLVFIEHFAVSEKLAGKKSNFGKNMTLDDSD